MSGAGGDNGQGGVGEDAVRAAFGQTQPSAGPPDAMPPDAMPKRFAGGLF